MIERNIVIIDNNFAIREVLKTELEALAELNSVKFNLFSSENGIEGLGYLYVTEPDIVILDTTLPKYSGNELLYYVLTNKRFHNDNVKVLIITESQNTFKVPKNFTVISKEEEGFIDQLITKIADTLKLKEIKGLSHKKLSSVLIKYANGLDMLRSRFDRADLLTKLIQLPIIVFYELIVSILLTINYFTTERVVEANVKQKRRDLSQLRRKHYPNVVISMVATLLLGVFGLSLLFSQGLLFRESQEETTAYGEIKWFSTLDSESDITAPFEGTAGELVGSPVFDEGYGGNAPIFDSDNEAVRIVNPVEGEDYSLERGAIEFYYNPLQAHTTDLELTFFSVYYDANNKIEFKKLNNGSDSLSLAYTCDGCDSAEELVNGSDYTWEVGSWLRLRAEWDATANLENQLRIFVDEELPDHTNNTSPIDAVSMPNANYIYIGNSSATGTNEANGQIDEFSIYTDVTPPTATPVGTPAPTPVYQQNSGSPSWYSTLNDEEAVTTPVAGTGGTVSGASFIDGPDGFDSSAHFDNDGESIDVSIVQGIDYSLNEGAIEFYYRPLLAYSSNNEITLFAIRYDDDNEIRLYKKDNAGSNQLALDFSCPGTCNGEEIVASADYSADWNIGEWTHFRVTWNDSETLANQLQIRIDGSLPTSTNQIGDIDPGSISDEPVLYIGNSATDGTTEAQGSIDDFKIFLTTIVPTATNTPVPSNTPSPSITPIPSITPTSTPTPIWYSTMNDLNAITTPVIGSGATATDGLSFVAGQVDNATKIDNTGDYIHMSNVAAGDFDETSGRVTFYYRADTFSQNGREMVFWQFRNGGGDTVRLIKESDNDLMFEYSNTSVGSSNYNRLVVDPSDYYWAPGQWVYFELFYDTTLTDSDFELRLFLDGNEPDHTHLNGNQVTTAVTNINNFYIGNQPGGSSNWFNPIRGVIDEFRVYDYFVNVPTPTVPANSPTPTEAPSLGILWYSTMDNATSLTSPVTGTAMSTLTGLTYVTDDGRTGTDFNQSGDCAKTTPNATDFSIIKGEVEFYFNPNEEENGGFTGVLFQLRQGGQDDYIRLRHEGDNSLLLTYKSDTTRTVSISAANYSSLWVTGSWMHISARWDDSLPEADKLQLFINDTEPTHTDSGTMDVDSMTLFNDFTIGNLNNCAAQRARGIIDEFKIWGIGTGITPTPSPSPFPTTAANPIWYSTLNNASALSTPAVGDAVTSSNVTYQAGVVNDGVKIDSDSEHVTVSPIPSSQFMKSEGAIEFYYIPDFEESVNQTITFFNVGSDSNNYLRLTKANNAANDVLNLDYKISAATRRLQVSVAQYQNLWTAGNSILFRIEWDESLDGTEDLKLFLNGNELAHTDTGTQFTAGSGTYTLTIGNESASGTNEALGVIDEFKIFGNPNSRNYYINDTGDGGDNSLGDFTCEDSSGDCTLRAAIQEANQTAAEDNIIFNIPGDGPHIITPGTELPAITSPGVIDGTQEAGVSCSNSTLKIVLDGSSITGDGLIATSDNVTIRGLVIISFNDAIYLNSSANSDIYCNILGLDSDGSSVQRNTNSGINAVNVSDNLVIGGSSASERNLISGNENGIIIDDSDAVTIIGNYIGTNKTGELNKGNTKVGISATSSDSLEIGGTDGTAFGTTCQGDCNLISSNGSSGIVIGNGSTESNNIDIIGNYLGTTLDGSSSLNNFDGIKITKAATLNIESNVINTNLNGIYLASVQNGDVSSAVITDNILGLNDTATTSIGNGSNGIVAFSGPNSTTSDILIFNNVIGGMKLSGIYGYGTGTSQLEIIDNYIGTNSSSANLGNKYGIWFLYPNSNNIIGGINSWDGNIISNNTSYGVYLSNSSQSLLMNNTINNNGSDGVAVSGVGSTTGAVNNTIIENSIYDNGKLAINLRLGSGDGPSGVTPNDDQDGDETANPGADGPNDLQNFPLILQSTYDGTDLDLTGFFNSEPNTYFRLDFYSNEEEDPSGYGEAENHIYSTVVQTNANGNYNFSTTPITISSVSMPATHENFSATATECIDQNCDVLSGTLNTSEVGKTGFESKLLPKSLSLDEDNERLFIAGDGTSIISDILSFDIDSGLPFDDTSHLTFNNSYNTLNYSPMDISDLNSEYIATVGSSDSDQYRVYPASLSGNYCSAIDLSSDVKATNITVAGNSVGSEYAFITTEDPNNEIFIIRGDSSGTSYPRQGVYLSEIHHFDPLPYYHSVVWDETLFDGGDVRLQVRTSTTSNIENEEWYGPDGTRGSYFDNPGDIIPEVVQGKGYFQYKLIIDSDQITTSTLNSITVRYKAE